MDENNFEKNEIEDNIIIETKNDNLNKIEENIQISYNDNIEILNKIFKKSKDDNSRYIPILIKNSEEEMLKIFSEKIELTDEISPSKYFLQKLNLISQIISISNNSPEILYIISDFLSKKNTSIYICIIDLYISFIQINQNPDIKENILIEIRKIFLNLNSIGLLSKIDVDFIYQKIALFQLEKKINIKIFHDIIQLLEIMYTIDNNLKKEFIAKNYFYFYDKETSAIDTNISENKFIQIKKGFTVALWFYLKEINEDSKYKTSLLNIKNEKGDKVNVILNEKNDIDIYYKDTTYIKAKENKNFNIEKNIWTRLIIWVNKNEINLFLAQEKESSGNSASKRYEINNISFNDCKITEISFFKNFIGIADCIFFFKDIDKSKISNIPIIVQSLTDIKFKNVNDKLSEKNLSEHLYFILSPNLYVYNQQIKAPKSKIIGRFPEKNNNKYNLNSLFSSKNYINNIFYLGGFNNFLPLFEIFYKFSLDENNTSDIDIIMKNSFCRLFNILENVLTDKKINCRLSLSKDINFFPSLSIFMKRIDEKYYNDNEQLLKKLINIGKICSNLIESKIIDVKQGIGYLNYILFSPEIIIKFNLDMQKILFEELKKFYIYMPCKSNIKFLILLSRKYPKNEIEKNDYSKTLFEYIKKLFENHNLNDVDRENYFLLYKNKSNKISDKTTVSDNIFIHIINNFNLYLDTNINIIGITEEKKNMRRKTVEFLLNSKNNFIEILLQYLSDTNIHIKNVIINFLRVLTQIYGDLLEQYFNKLGRKDKRTKVNKEEFYIFIKENIAPNYNNAKIKDNGNLDIAIRKNSTPIFNLKEGEISTLNNIPNDKNKIISLKALPKEKEEMKLNKKRNKSLNKEKKVVNTEALKNISIILSDKPKISRKNSFNKLKFSLKKIILNEENQEKIIKKSETIQKVENKNVTINNKEELTLEKKIEIRDAKAEIALILYNWLLSLVTETDKNVKEKNKESINHSIEYFVKFISFTKELDVILRILILIGAQKSNIMEKKNKYQNNYNLLLHYLLENSLFLQLLIELLINSYIYKNIYSNNTKPEEDDFIILSNDIDEIKRLKLKYFTIIYEKALEIFLDVYFLDNTNYKVDILSKIFLISLKLLLQYQDSNDINKKNLLCKFLKQIFIEINLMFDIQNKPIKRYYLDLFTFFMDYCFMFNNADELLQYSYRKIKEDRTNCLPDFLVCGLIHENEISYQWSGNDIYAKIFNNLKKLFCINNIFHNLEIIYRDVNKQKEKNKYIFEYDINFFTALINEIVYKKKKDGNIQTKNINGLFYSYDGCGYDNNFPMINIISLFNSLSLHLLYYDTNNGMDKEKLISLLNDIQNYIIFLLILSLIVSPKDTIEPYNTPINYDEIQELLYKNIFFNIQNLFNRLNDKDNKNYYLQILHDITLFLTVIYNIEAEESQKRKNKSIFKNMFSSNNIDLSNTAPSMLIDYYTKNYANIFNEKNFKIFLQNDKDTNIKIIEDNIKYNEIKNINNMKDNPSFNMYNIKYFEKVVFKREAEINNIKILIDNKDKENKGFDDYKNIYLKIKKIKLDFFTDEVEEQQKEIFKIKAYRKIKKDLYSFNNSYSNLQVFYNIPLGQKPYHLKYKVSNFLSKDMSRKFLKPIIDIDYFMPNFRKYKPAEKNLFQHSKNDIYLVDLQIFKNKKRQFVYPNVKINMHYHEKYFLEENVCYVKTSNHVKGALFHPSINKKLSENYLYFCVTKLPCTEIKLKTYEDYDSLNESCYNSIFRNNMNTKDQDVYLKLNLDEIIFIFNRKYSFRDNAVEIFTSFHRSYYFKLRTNEKRNNFVEHIVYILNKDSSIFKKLFKPIYSINEFGKKITLGYYKDIDNNGEYASMYNIKEMWKNSKISSFEFLLWINIYGNRSFRDISQYPVFPWVMTDYNLEKFEDIINNGCIRNFNLPMGLMSLSEKGKERQEGYIATYRMMCMDLRDEELVDFKIKDEDEEDEETTLNDQNEENINNTMDSSIVSVDKINDANLPKIPLYKYDIEKIYRNQSIEYEKIPYFFGSHFSNAMYISHYMGRIFPYSLTMIEIQGSGFDCSERLFICLEKTFASAATEKCDVRELIPEFFYMPEFFLNINKLNFGEISIQNYYGAISYYDELLEKNQNKEKIVIDDVLLPKWCKDNPYNFIIKSRELLENNNLVNIGAWINLIFGYYQRGKPAQQIGNLFLPSSYDGVMNNRLSDEEILKNRNDTEYKLRLFELGVNPCKVFVKKITDKKRILKQITDTKKDIDKINAYIVCNNDINYIASINNNMLLLFENDYKIKKIMVEEKNESSKGFKTKEFMSFNFSKDVFKNENYYKLYVKYFNKSNMILLAGFYSRNIYLLPLEKIANLKLNDTNTNIFSKMKMADQLLLISIGLGFITSFEVSQDEKYIIYGNNNGTLIILEFIYYNNTFQFPDNYEIKLLKVISSHSGYSIKSISINIDLNIFADCSEDNFIHMYTLPKCEKINSIYNNNSLFYIDHILLSAQPLPSVILYCNKEANFKVYNINGHDLNVEQNDKSLVGDNDKNFGGENMISPIIFTNWQFSDYLIYIFRYKFILLRKTPLMDVVFKISFGENEIISMINLSLMKDCIYAVDNNNKKIHVIQCDKINNNK